MSDEAKLVKKYITPNNKGENISTNQLTFIAAEVAIR
jgi:hypothetical protein